jgi:hypothetical protein
MKLPGQNHRGGFPYSLQMMQKVKSPKRDFVDQCAGPNEFPTSLTE